MLVLHADSPKPSRASAIWGLDLESPSLVTDAGPGVLQRHPKSCPPINLSWPDHDICPSPTSTEQFRPFVLLSLRRLSRKMRGGVARHEPLRSLRTAASCSRARTFASCIRSSAGQPVPRPAAFRDRPRVLPVISSKPNACTACRVKLRSFATVANGTPRGGGPLAEYDRRVEAGTLRNDEHQRGRLAGLKVEGP